jgi:hypothetical protein
MLHTRSETAMQRPTAGRRIIIIPASDPTWPLGHVHELRRAG